MQGGRRSPLGPRPGILIRRRERVLFVWLSRALDGGGGGPRRSGFSLRSEKELGGRLLTPQVGRALAVHHAGRQRAVVRRRAAEQDVVGQGLVQHGAVGAGVGALPVGAHALVRQRPVQGAPRRQGALRGKEGGR